MSHWVNLESDELPVKVREVTGGRGADVVFDVVGGAMFERCLASLAHRGRQVAIASGPERRVTFDLIDFYHNQSRLLAVDSLKLSFEQTGAILRELSSGLERGFIRSLPRKKRSRCFRWTKASRFTGIWLRGGFGERPCWRREGGLLEQLCREYPDQQNPRRRPCFTFAAPCRTVRASECRVPVQADSEPPQLVARWDRTGAVVLRPETL